MYYAVQKGKKTGIYNSWDDCKKQVIGYSGAVFKKFQTLNDANQFLKTGYKTDKIKNKKIKKENNIKSTLGDNIKSTLGDNLESYNLYTDGSLIRKKGDIYAGYGVYIPKLEIKRSFKLESQKTNNRAELLAIFNAIEVFKKNKQVLLNIYTDSKYSILIFTKTGEKYEKNNYKDSKNNDVKNKDLVKYANKLKKKYNLNFIHIRSHTGLEDVHSKGNEIADELAVKGALS
ncbi:RNase H [seawater metagenome]|uniref:ribonuclease H n=1 Tax=seawater metagenome TaxID=1561972 RepID=A0A5E8CJH0_9ZZZZ